MGDFVTAINWLWSLAGVKFLVAHIAFNIVVAVAASLKSGDFALSKTPEFLWRKVLPLVLVYGSARAIGADAGLDYLAPIVFAMIETALLADLSENLTRLGVPVPDQIATILRKHSDTIVVVESND